MGFPTLTVEWGSFALIVWIALLFVIAFAFSAEGDKINFPLLILAAAFMIGGCLTWGWRWDEDLSAPWDTIALIAGSIVTFVSACILFLEVFRGKGIIADWRAKKRIER